MQTEITTPCKNCKFAVLKDNGYSNYTVMGTDFHCAKKVHPAGEFDMYYWKALEFKLVTACNSFEAGRPFEVDIEGDALAQATEEEKAIYKLAFGG